MTVIVMRTACGCEKQTDWNEPLPPSIRVPMMQQKGINASLGDEPKFYCREFFSRGLSGIHPLYIERAEVLADPPPAPQLTTDEWAEACARADRWQRGMDRDAEWTKADLDFVRRHDGASLIHHAKTNQLMGAWYSAPTWENSSEIVRLFTMLRALNEEAS